MVQFSHGNILQDFPMNVQVPFDFVKKLTHELLMESYNPIWEDQHKFLTGILEFYKYVNGLDILQGPSVVFQVRISLNLLRWNQKMHMSSTNL